MGGVALYFYKNIKPVLTTEINKALAVEVSFNAISISGLKDFPKLGITISGVKINESTPVYRQKLLVATEISLFLDLLKLWKGEYVIDAVSLRNGQLNLADLKKGTNYDIIKPSSDTSSSSDLSFEIKRLTLINCDVNYKYIPKKLQFQAFTPKSKINLKYLGAKTEIGLKGSLKKTLLTYNNETYINKRDIKLNTAFSILSDKTFLTVDESDIAVEDIELKTSGNIFYGKNQSIDLKFASNNTTAQSLLSILPESTKKDINDIKLKGNVKLNGDLKGPISVTKSPAFHLDFTLGEGEISVSGQSISLSGIDANASIKMPDISNFSSASAICVLKQAKSETNILNGEINIQNFENPEIAWKGIADLDVPFLTSFQSNPSFVASAGKLKIDGELKCRLNANTVEANSLYFSGNILGNNIQGKLDDPSLTINSVNFDISADNTKMSINDFQFSYNDVKGQLSGYISDYHSLLSPENKSELVGKLEIENLNINDLYSTKPSDSNQKEAGSNEVFPLRVNLNSTLRNLQYNDFTAQEISGHLVTNTNAISMPECKIKALEGETSASITLKNWGNDFLLDINSKISEVSITQLFKQFNNFEQTEITDQNLSGKLSGSILAKIVLDPNFEPILPKLYVKADVTISNGQLKNYEPLKELSAFVEIKDLEDVKFKTLTNTIEIFDQTIFIPKMRIENSALNLELEGTHTFDNYMNYNMSLSVAELLATRANWIAKKKERRIENNVSGGLTAYITMKGTPDDLKIAYDGATVKENVKEELAKEKSNFIKAMKGEATLEKETSETKNYDDVWDE